MLIVQEWSRGRIVRFYQDAIRRADEHAEATEQAAAASDRSAEAVAISRRAAVVDCKVLEAKLRDVANAVKAERSLHEEAFNDVRNAHGLLCRARSGYVNAQQSDVDIFLTDYAAEPDADKEEEDPAGTEEDDDDWDAHYTAHPEEME
jgi:hypothetical protein